MVVDFLWVSNSESFALFILQKIFILSVGIVVYNVTIVAIGHEFSKMAYGNELRSKHCREFPYLKPCKIGERSL